MGLVASAPVRLHLDTSDYAGMCRAAAGTLQARIRDQLVELSENGQIEIGLSYHVVFELLQKAEPKYREGRLARAECLRQLCGSDAFPYPSDLGQGYGFSKDGLWVPRIYLNEIDIDRLVRLVREGITHSPVLPRHVRRMLSNQSGFVSFVRDHPQQFRSLARELWPLEFGWSFVEDGDLRRYILGYMTRDVANKTLRTYITDPTSFYEIWYEKYHRDNPALIRRDAIAIKITVMLNELKGMLDETSKIRLDVDRLLKVAPDMSELSAEDRANLLRLKQEIRDFRGEITSPEEMAKLPAWREMAGEEGSIIAAQIFYALYREQRDLRESDAIDLIHAMYLPHADLWRGDRAFSHLLIKNRVHLHEKVVPSLVELPDRITKALSP
jgi:hypothetical protein